MPKISSLPAISTTLSVNDVLPIVDDNDGSTKKVTIASILALMFPIGSYYTNETDSTNPGTLLGFGTWVAASTGRVPVGKAASGTFATAGATMGTENETLSSAQMPNHSHSAERIGGGYGAQAGGSGYAGNLLVTNASGGSGVVGYTGGGGSHNNIQPSIVVYIWKRTA